MDPNPFKHPAIVLARIRKAVEPSLIAAGFQFDGRNKPERPVHLYLDYSRPGELFRLAWDRRDSNRFIGVTAELLDAAERSTTIAAVDMSRSVKLPASRNTAEIQTKIDSIVEDIIGFLRKLPPNETACL